MQTQWDEFVKKMILNQGHNQNYQSESNDERDDLDDVTDFDDGFPITMDSGVEEL